MRRLIDAILALFALVAIAGAMSVGGPALDEFDAVRDAQAAAERRDRFERSAQEQCGENSVWRELGNGAVVCHTKHGRKTHVVQVTL